MKLTSGKIIRVHGTCIKNAKMKHPAINSTKKLNLKVLCNPEESIKINFPKNDSNLGQEVDSFYRSLLSRNKVLSKNITKIRKYTKIRALKILDKKAT